MAPRFPFDPYPSGWFRVAAGRDLRPGQVRSLHYFGRDLVLFRAENGDLTLLDAHCPHLGAHLGLGKVKGSSIQCAFHGWCFGGKGDCTGLPGNRQIPRNARGRTWPIREVNGMVMAWYHPRGEAPTWEYPAYPEGSDPEWTKFHNGPRLQRIRTHPQEMLENAMDLSHFSFLHSQQTIAAKTLSVETDGPRLVHHTFQHYNVFRLAKLFVKKVTGTLDICMYGLGGVVNRATVDAKIHLSYAFSFFFTPIDDEHLEVNSIIAMKRLGNRLVEYLLLKKAMAEGQTTVGQDVPIWETKIYHPRPRLSEGEGAITLYRKWAQQFYDTSSTSSSRSSVP